MSYMEQRRFRGTKLGGVITLAVFGYCMISFLISWVITARTEPANRLDSVEPGRYSYQIQDGSQFKFLWQVDDIAISTPQDGEIKMTAVNGQLFVVGEQQYAVLGFDGVTGETRRRYDYYEAPYVARAKTILSNNDYLVIGFEGTGKVVGNSDWGAAQIHVLKLESGETIWETAVSGVHSIGTMNLYDQKIWINSTSVLDIKQHTVTDAEASIWFEDGQVTYGTSDDSALAAYNNIGRTQLWSSQLKQAIFQPIVKQKDWLIVRSGESDQTGTVYLFDKLTGHLRWQFNGVTSNIDVDEDHLFFYTVDNKLVVVDLRTAELMDEVTFSSAEANDAAVRSYSIAVDDKQVFVYFDETQQLFAFQFGEF